MFFKVRLNLELEYCVSENLNFGFVLGIYCFVGKIVLFWIFLLDIVILLVNCCFLIYFDFEGSYVLMFVLDCYVVLLFGVFRKLLFGMFFSKVVINLVCII